MIFFICLDCLAKEKTTYYTVTFEPCGPKLWKLLCLKDITCPHTM